MSNQVDIINLLKDKSSLLEYLQNMIVSSDKFALNLPKLRERGFSEQGMLDKVVEVTAIQSQQIKHLALIALLLVQSREFDTMVGHMMINMGRGEEVLRAMLDKLRGGGK